MQECNDALTTFKKAQEIMEDKRERRYKEFVKFFSTTVAQKGDHKLVVESVFVYELLMLSILSKCNQSRCVHYFSLFCVKLRKIGRKGCFCVYLLAGRTLVKNDKECTAIY